MSVRETQRSSVSNEAQRSYRKVSDRVAATSVPARFESRRVSRQGYLYRCYRIIVYKNIVLDLRRVLLSGED